MASTHRVRQRPVGFVQTVEFLRRVAIARVLVGVVLSRKTPVRLLNDCGVGRMAYILFHGKENVQQ